MRAEPMSSPSRAVAVFSTYFLQYSQTFVYSQLQHHQRYRAEVFCQRRMNADRFPYPHVHALNDQPGPLARGEELLYQITTLSPRWAKRLATGGFDLIHAHFGPGSVYALPYHAALRLPLVVTLHGYDVPLLSSAARFHPANWRYWAASKWLLRTVDRFIAASDELAEMMLRLGARPETVRVERLGIELPPAQPPPTGQRLLMVGRFVEKKGFEYGLRGFAAVAHQFPAARLAIIGDGERRDGYLQLAAELGIADRVDLLGVLSHDQVLDEMSRCAILLAPSVVARDGNRESGLIVVKEAAARSVPTIGTYHGGIPEIIDDDRTGYLVAERDAASIGDRIARLLGDVALHARMGHAARAKMEAEYEVGGRVAALEAHYDEVLANRRR